MTLHVLPTLGRLRLDQLQPQHIRTLYSQLIDEGHTPALVGFVHSVLHSALKQAVRLDLVPRNVTDAVAAPRKRVREFSVLDSQQVGWFLDAARGNRLEALFVLAVTTGMRRGELLAVRWRDVDLDRGLLRVTQQLIRVTGKGLTFTEPKTTRCRRHIALPAMAVEALRTHRTRQLEERLQAGPEWADSGLVFTNHHGGPVEISRMVAGPFKTLLKRAGLPDIRFHDLRHTAATLLLSQGVNPKVVQERLGHSAIAITMDVYSHVLPDIQADAAAQLDRLLSRAR